MRGNNLMELDLCGARVFIKGVLLLADVLRTNTSVVLLNLSQLKIGDSGAKALARALHCNSALAELHLSYNQIGNRGVVALAQALPSNSSLRGLYLDCNRVGDVGTQALSEGLSCNSSLKVLGLSENRIGDAGAEALAKGLHSLTHLYLSGNTIGDVGAAELAEALQVNSTLTSLELSCTPIFLKNSWLCEDELCMAWVGAIKVNQTLKWLSWSVMAHGEPPNALRRLGVLQSCVGVLGSSLKVHSAGMNKHFYHSSVIRAMWQKDTANVKKLMVPADVLPMVLLEATMLLVLKVIPVEVVKELVTMGANASKAFLLAAEEPWPDMMVELVALGADVHTYGREAMLTALKKGCYESVRQLCAMGAPLTLIDERLRRKASYKETLTYLEEVRTKGIVRPLKNVCLSVIFKHQVEVDQIPPVFLEWVCL